MYVCLNIRLVIRIIKIFRYASRKNRLIYFKPARYIYTLSEELTG